MNKAPFQVFYKIFQVDILLHQHVVKLLNSHANNTHTHFNSTLSNQFNSSKMLLLLLFILIYLGEIIFQLELFSNITIA